jgi:hypothetical protein
MDLYDASKNVLQHILATAKHCGKVCGIVPVKWLNLFIKFVVNVPENKQYKYLSLLSNGIK